INLLRRPETGDAGFVGGFIRRVTPVPIPNTVVKPAEPMILRQRESRSLPALNKNPDHSDVVGVLFCARDDAGASDLAATHRTPVRPRSDPPSSVNTVPTTAGPSDRLPHLHRSSDR